jgi:hypothetical protein
MIRRAVLLGAVLAGAFAPGAQAAKIDTLSVKAVGSMVPSQAAATPDGEVTLSVSCSASDPTSTYYPAYVYNCSVGPLRVNTYCGFECFGMPFEAGTRQAPFSTGYELCVGAGSFGITSTDFFQCKPLDPVTGTAVISG